MPSRMVYIFTRTCQGQRQERIEFYSLIKAVLYWRKNIRKYGKYGTMRFDLTAWKS